MRILLVTDTHNELDVINDLIETEYIDCCIHCGDFGFYDEDSLNRLTHRELQLRIRHSHLPKDVRKQAYDLSHNEAKAILKEHNMLGGFIPFLTGEQRFAKPVYAVWGNHDDRQVVNKLLDGTYDVPNLHLIDEHNHYTLEEANLRVFGVGGNFYLEGDKLFAPEKTGAGGKIRASWLQYARLLEDENQRKRNKKDKTRTMFVSHVSPGKSECRILERLCLALGVNVSVSGHMDPPVCHAYSLFAICENDEAIGRSQPAFGELKRRWREERDNTQLDDLQKALVDRSIARLDVEDFPVPDRRRRPKKGSMESNYYATQFLNLADTPEGWAIMDIEGDEITLHMRSKWHL
ncbi:MAG: hypothetical protein CL920_04665 [Deltaproteobacteria bacterium]|nr:hypothetical protein [Deltaproteobacteria bacterium]MBU47971.1 hypothetical protein [Deltaproteobacteria bacterium]|tara:strand:+ start:6916 stop:7962 length:1047 start_codon:yes stop_codon:yes gene_type:complete